MTRIIEWNGQSKSIKEWCLQFGISDGTLRHRIDDLGWSIEESLTLPPKSRISNVGRPRKYLFNERFFSEIDTPRKAYWLGFLYADGCLRENNTLSLGLKHSDKYVIEELCSDLGYDGKIRYVNSKNGFNVVEITSKAMAEDLRRWGLEPVKTFRTQPPSIPDFLSHFIRGLFDGDGCVMCKKYGDRTYVGWDICGQEDLLKFVRSVVSTNAGVKLPTVKRCGDKCVWRIGCNTSVSIRKTPRSHDILDFSRFIYGSTDFFLERKKRIFDHIESVVGQCCLSPLH